MHISISRSLTLVLAVAALPLAGLGQVAGRFAVVYTQEPGSKGSYRVMSREECLQARREAQDEARLIKMALAAARDEWNEDVRERTRRERDRDDRNRHRHSHEYNRQRQQRNSITVRTQSFPDIGEAVACTLRCVGLYMTAAEAEKRAAVLTKAQEQGAGAALSGKMAGGFSSSSSSPVSIESRMPTRLSKSNFASSSFGKSSKSSSRDRDDGKWTSADIKKATKLYEEHLARLRESGEDGSGLKKPSYLSADSDSNLKVKRMGNSLERRLLD